MKKSQLLKIVKESAKETLNEQNYPPSPTMRWVEICNCKHYDLATSICNLGYNGPNGGWTFNIDFANIGGTGPLGIGPVDVISPTVGDIFCHMYGINGPTGIINSGNPADCLDDTGSSTQKRIILSDLSAYNSNGGGTAIRALLPPNTTCGLGCTDPLAPNYNPNASHNYTPSDCLPPEYGCTDPLADNYDFSATIDDGTCFYVGCADSTAVNYDPADDGCGIPPDPTDISCCDYEGCIDPNAINYDSSATIDSGSCYGCMDSTALNYCPLCNIDCSGIVGNITDDSCCNYTPIPGCMDPAACNYDYTATISNNTCDYSCYGCTDPTALNYDFTATIDDGSCIYPVEGCADPSAVYCSQQPGILQNLSNCYDPDHYGCNNDPNDTSCCLYEARDRDDTSSDCTPHQCPAGWVWLPHPECRCHNPFPRPTDVDHLDIDRDRNIDDCTTSGPKIGCWACKIDMNGNTGCSILFSPSQPYFNPTNTGVPGTAFNYYNTEADCLAAGTDCQYEYDLDPELPDDGTVIGEGLKSRFQKLANISKK